MENFLENMDFFEHNQIGEFAYIAFSKVQLLTEKEIEKKKLLSRVLDNDKWWLDLSAGTHRRIGSYLNKYKSEIIERYEKPTNKKSIVN